MLTAFIVLFLLIFGLSMFMLGVMSLASIIKN
jgi:hypothetical protein